MLLLRLLADVPSLPELLPGSGSPPWLPVTALGGPPGPPSREGPSPLSFALPSSPSARLRLAVGGPPRSRAGGQPRLPRKEAAALRASSPGSGCSPSASSSSARWAPCRASPPSPAVRAAAAPPLPLALSPSPRLLPPPPPAPPRACSASLPPAGPSNASPERRGPRRLRSPCGASSPRLREGPGPAGSLLDMGTTPGGRGHPGRPG